MQYDELPRWVRDLPVYRPVRKWTEMPTYTGRLDDYVNQMLSAKKFNNEGEKQMEKIDWHKPLRAFKTPGHEVVDAKVYTYKSGRQRVVWVDERVYPVDDQGRAVADVDYGSNWVKKGSKLVENVPEEKFFVGLYRFGNNRYKITDCGQTTTMGVLSSWKRLMADQPHWIVDTRKAIEPPKAIEHDPEDYVTVWFDKYDDEPKASNYVMTRTEAEASVSEPGEQVVRIRTTPPPADTARYIQLWRATENEPWRINALGNGCQEFTWDETKHRDVSPTRAAIKVCD